MYDIVSYASVRILGVIAIKTDVFLAGVVQYDKKHQKPKKDLIPRTNVAIMWTIWRVGPVGSAGQGFRNPAAGQEEDISFLDFEYVGREAPPEGGASCA